MATRLCKIVADFRTSLAAKISIGGTTATLVSATDDDGVALPAGNYFFTIDGDNSSKEHILATLSGTALTAIKSVSRQGVQTSGVAREHRTGATVTITDFAHIKELNDLLLGVVDLNGAVPLKYDTDPTLTDDKHLATKKYVDDTAIAGAPDMSVTVKGIAEEATQSEIDADTATGGTGARLAINPSTLATSKYGTRLPSADQKAALAGTGTPSGANKFVTKDTHDTDLGAKEDTSNKDTTTTLGTSDTKYPSQKATKTYVDTQVATAMRTSKNGSTTLSYSTFESVKTIAHGLGVIPKKITLIIDGRQSNNQHAIAFWGSSGQCSSTLTHTVQTLLSASDAGTVNTGNAGNKTITITADATNITITISPANGDTWSCSLGVTWCAEA